MGSWGYPDEPEIAEGMTQIVVPVDRSQDVVDYLNGNGMAEALLLVRIEPGLYVDPARIQAIGRNWGPGTKTSIVLEAGACVGSTLSPDEVVEVLHQKLFDPPPATE